MREVKRVILHLDMDAFYAAVEMRENPALAGKALIVGGRGRRGVVSTCSYEARKYGVCSAMPSVVADRLCPHATWVRGRMHLYSEVSRAIRRILARHSPLIEPLSIDEAFIDLTGIAADLEAGAEQAKRIKRSIVDEQRLTASVGVAPNKFLAKVASDLDKPDGLVLLPIAYLTFLLLINQKSLLGDQMLRGRKRFFANLVMAVATGVALFASGWAIKAKGPVLRCPDLPPEKSVDIVLFRAH